MYNFLKLKKTQILLLMISFVFVILTILLLINKTHFYQENTANRQLYTQQNSTYHNLSFDLVELINTVNSYLISGDSQDLKNYSHLSSQIIEQELTLQNISTYTKKQDLNNLLNNSKIYFTFIEKEIISANNQQINTKQLLSRQNLYSQKLQNQLSYCAPDEPPPFNQAELEGIFILLLVFLFVFIACLLAFLMPLLSQGFYLKELNDSINSPALVVDQKGEFLYINQCACLLFALKPNTLLNKKIAEIPLLFPHLQVIVQPLEDVLAQKQPVKNYLITYFHDETKTELNAIYSPIFKNKKLAGAIFIAQPAESQKNSRVLLHTLETERKRLSIEIHDWIGRYMSTIIHSLDYLLRIKDQATSEELKNNLLTLRSHCQQSALEMRSIMNDIHPYLIDKVGLIPALESYIATYEKLNNIKVYISYQDRSLRLQTKDEIIIYRVIQEALSNIIKHSKATEVDVNFILQQDILEIEIADNGGKGGQYTMGKGLWGMKERANLTGGDIIFFHDEEGFTVKLTLPITLGG